MITKLNKYLDDGWLISKKHDYYDLIIWNYSQSTQYESFWNETTLMARGLITDSLGNIVSRGFNKFFNWEENKLDRENIDLSKVKLFEKVDGSYIGVFWYDNQWITNSKGSFTTEQAIKAKEHINSFKDFDKFFSKDLTHNFEIVYPTNRIVVDYNGIDGIVYLSSTNKAGDIFFLETICDGMLRSKEYDFNFDYELIKSQNTNNEEGIVGYLPCGNMFKIKFANYIALHGIITNTSSYTIWECLRNGEDVKLMVDNIPDEFYGFVKSKIEEITTNFKALFVEVHLKYLIIPFKDELTDKEFATRIKDEEFKSQFFSLRNGRDISEWVWKKVKPKYELPFSTEN